MVIITLKVRIICVLTSSFDNSKCLCQRNLLSPPSSPSLQYRLPLTYYHPPDSRFLIALDFANSNVVTHLCLSTSLRALKWYTCDGPFVMTKLVASIVSMKAPAKLTVPRHVCAISSCVLQQYRHTERINHLTRTHTTQLSNRLLTTNKKGPMKSHLYTIYASNACL